MGSHSRNDVPPGLLDEDGPDPEFSFAGRKKIGREEPEEVLGTAGNLCWSHFLICCTIGSVRSEELWTFTVHVSAFNCTYVSIHTPCRIARCLYKFFAPMTREALFVSTGRGMEDPKNHQLIRALTRGIEVHHSGLPKGYRQSVEILFRCGHLRVVIATGSAHSVHSASSMKIGWLPSSSRNVCYRGE